MSCRTLLTVIAALSLLLALAACGEGETTEPPAPDAATEAGADAGIVPAEDGTAVEPSEPEATVPPAEVTQTIEAAQPGEQQGEADPTTDTGASAPPAQIPGAISPENAASLVELDRVELQTESIVWLDWSDENRLIAAATSSGVYLLDPGGDREPVSINPTGPTSGTDTADQVDPQAESAPARAQFAPGAPVLAVEPAAPDGQATLWSLEDLSVPNTEDLSELNQLIEGASRIAFSPTGDLIATASAAQPGTVTVWSIADRQPLHEIEVEDFMAGGDADSARTIDLFTFSPDGTLLAAEGGPGSGVVNIYRLDTGEQVQRLEIGDPQEAPTPIPLMDASWQRLAWIAEGVAIIVDAQTGEEIQRVEHGSFIEAAAFSPDGRLLVTSSAEGGEGEPEPVLTLWDTETGEAIHTLSGFTGLVQAITFSDDGSLLTTGSSDGNLRLWGVPEAGE